MTVRRILNTIVSVNLVMTLCVSALGFWGITVLSKELEEAAVSTQLLKLAGDADMMHDALRGDVFGALLSQSKLEGLPSADEVALDIKDHEKTFLDSVQELKELAFTPEMIAEIDLVVPRVHAYAAEAKSIAALAIEGKEIRSSNLESFNSKFGDLEGEMEKLSELISKFSEEARAKGGRDGAFFNWAQVVFCVIAIVLGAVVSYFMSRSLNRRLERIIANLERATASSGKANEILNSAAGEVASATTEQAAAVQESVASMAEMSSMIAQTSDNAKRSLDIVQNVTQKTDEGGQIMERMVSSMELIQQSNQNLHEMVNIIRAISEKAGVINDIVFKTQLLSFNASIEAARAGQHGRGFAVVAEEVGNLADVSGGAAKEIQSLLESSERQVSTIIEETKRRVSDGQDVSKHAKSMFEQIAKEVYGISSQVQGITDATKEQELGVQQTNTAMSQMDEATRRTSVLSQEASSSAEDLKDQIVDLREIVRQLGLMVYGKRNSTQPVPSSGSYELARQESNEGDEYSEEQSAFH